MPNSPGADFSFDSALQNKFPESALKGATHLLSCIPPDQNGEDPVLKSIGPELKEMPLKWVGYLSTTGVYGDSKGGWVKESDKPNPQQKRSKRRLSCEKAWQNSGLPIQVLRLPGIYGPGRSAIDNLKRGNAKMIDKPGQVFSRIHVEDIAGSIFHLIHLYNQGINPKIINISDSMPTTNIEVLNFASILTGLSLPEIESFEVASKKMSPMAISFWQENRRVSNELLCNSLGYSLLHPNYKVGLKDCLRVLKIN
tara:strand:+ start:450 stop:1211 length:762 start_codon:yes stop_codon:yes gene_type:complete